eukprot:PITA_31841
MAFEDDDFMDAIDEEGLYEEISKLKICLEEKNMIIDTLQFQLAESEKHHEKLECEIVGLRKEIEKTKALNIRFVKGSKTLDEIIKVQHSPLIKRGLRYNEEATQLQKPSTSKSYLDAERRSEQRLNGDHQVNHGHFSSRMNRYDHVNQGQSASRISRSYNRPQFEPRVDEGVLLGYSPHSKAYKCYNKRLGKIAESIDVVVDEEEKNSKQVRSKDFEDDEDYPSTSNQIHDEEETYEEETHEEPEEQRRIEEKTPSRYVQKNHPETQILGQKEADIQRIRTIAEASSYLALLSSIEPQNGREACKDECCVKAMDEELEQIKKNNTWELVPRPKDKNAIGTKWIFKNKLNENGEVIRNKARLVFKGYAQQE